MLQPAQSGPTPGPARKEAILIMDSRSTPAAVRHQGFYGSWSRLYKAGDMYLDLSLKADGQGAALVGQVIAEAQRPTARAVTLRGPGGSASSAVSEYGGFRLAVGGRGDHRLEFELGEERYVISGLEVA